MSTLASKDRVSTGLGGDVGVAVVGAGYWGPNLVRNFFDVAGCRVVAVCDRDQGRLAALGKRHPSVHLTTTFDAILRDPAIDAVAIATPVCTHAELVRRALEAGKHVLVEKPMTTSVADAEELVEVAERKRLVLLVDHTFVYTSAVREIKRLIDTGEVGNLYYYDSVRVNLGLVQHDVNVVWDLAAHDVATMDYLIERSPRRVSAVASSHLPGGHADVAYIALQFDDDMIAHFHVNWLSPIKVRQVLIGGDRRMIVYDDLQPTDKVKVYDRGISWSADDEQVRRDARVGYRMGDMLAPRLDTVEALRTECGHFIDSIVHGARPLTDGVAGLRAVRMLAAAERSLQRDGRPETIDGQ